MGECMNYPEKPMDFIKSHSFVDQREIYTNGSELVSVFRVEQMMEQYIPRWIPFVLEYDEEKQMEMLCGKLPDDEEEILVTDGKNVWMDTFMIDEGGCYLDCGSEIVSTVIAWMPLPEPYKEG